MKSNDRSPPKSPSVLSKKRLSQNYHLGLPTPGGESFIQLEHAFDSVQEQAEYIGSNASLANSNKKGSNSRNSFNAKN